MTAGSRAFALFTGVVVWACGAPEPRPVPTSSQVRPRPQAPAEPSSSTPRTEPATATSAQRLATAATSSKRPNGLRVLRLGAPPGSLSHVALYVDAGPARTEVKPGLATLSARCLLAAAPGGREGESLDATLARLGAALDLSVEGRFARLEAAAPEPQLEALASLVSRIVTQPAPAPEVVEAEKRRLLAELEATRPARLRHNQIRYVLGEPVTSLEREELAVANTGAGEVHIFLGRYYRPAASLLVVRSASDKSIEPVGKLFDGWKQVVTLPELPKPGRVLPLHFAKTDDVQAEVIAILPSPRAGVTGSGLDEAVWQLLDAEGVSGHLRRRLTEHGFPDLDLPCTELDTGLARVRLYSARVPVSLAGRLMAAIRSACADLLEEQPDLETLRRASRRAMLLWDLTLCEPVATLREHAMAIWAGQDAKLDSRVINSLASMRADEAAAVAETRFVPTFLIRGLDAARPDGALEVPDLAGELAQSYAAVGGVRPLALDDAAAARLAQDVLAAACEKVGGKRALQALDSMSWRATSRYIGSFEITEQWSVPLPDGLVRRERSILATRIVTRETAEGRVVESVGNEELQIEAGEAGLFRLESRLHPIVLLALVVHGKLELRAKSRIALAGQTLLVLDGQLGADRIQVAIDEQSGLVRRIDWLEWQPKAAPRRASLELLDYHDAGRLRAPHLMRKFVDDELRAEIEIEY